MTFNRLQAIQKAEREATQRLAVLIDLAQKKADFDTLKAGYQEVIASIEAKYAIYVQELATQSLSLLDQQKEEARLQKTYLEEVSAVAVLLDRISGIEL